MTTEITDPGVAIQLLRRGQYGKLLEGNEVFFVAAVQDLLDQHFTGHCTDSDVVEQLCDLMHFYQYGDAYPEQINQPAAWE